MAKKFQGANGLPFSPVAQSVSLETNTDITKGQDNAADMQVQSTLLTEDVQKTPDASSETTTSDDSNVKTEQRNEELETQKTVIEKTKESALVSNTTEESSPATTASNEVALAYSVVKPIKKENRDHRKTILLTEELSNELTQLAKDTNRSFNDVVVLLLKNALAIK